MFNKENLMRANLPIMLLLMFCINPVLAEIYTCKDADGNTIYTDSPGACKDAEEVKVDELPTLIPTKPLRTTPSQQTATTKQDEKDLYTALNITSPEHDSVIRENQGNVTINFQVTPSLKTRIGHKFVVTVDGNEVYSGTSASASLQNMDRGTHTIGVKVVASDGSTQISAIPVTFTLHRFSALHSVDGTAPPDNGDDDDDNGINQDSFTFPGITRLPTRPPPPASN
jgi:hypothetical protein